LKIPSLSIGELDRPEIRAAELFGRNPQFGMDFICQLTPASEAATLCRQAIYQPPARLSFKQLCLIDVTGSLDAGLSLMNWIFEDVLDIRGCPGLDDGFFYRRQQSPGGRITPFQL
jgi:hypothetical protein